MAETLNVDSGPDAALPLPKGHADTMMTRTHAFVSLLCLSLVAPTLAVLPPPARAAASEAPIQFVSFDAYDYGFTGPDHIHPGLTTIQIVNTGRELHHIQLVKLDAGKTARQFTSAMKAEPGRFPTWAHFMGGPNAAAPGDRTAAVQDLQPGHYLLLCVIPDNKGAPHFALGMIKPLTVSSKAASRGTMVKPDVVITLSDFHFALSQPLTSGTHTIQVVNQGSQVHEAVVVQLPPNGSIKAFAAAFEPGAPLPDPPPGKPIGGVTGIEGGNQGWATIMFSPGRYGLICFFPDPATGAPHFTKGMMVDFDVK